MDKVNIKIIELGNTKDRIDKNKLEKYKSEFFKIEQFSNIEILPQQPSRGSTLNIVYSRVETANILRQEKFDGVIVGVMNYKFDDNFYMHRVRENAMVISLYGIKEILTPANIALESFIIKCIYEAICYYKACGNLVSDDIYRFVHPDTRGCLFDLNGDRGDIIYNTEKPIICDKCKGMLQEKTLPKGFLEKFCKELKRIDKPFLLKAELFIRKYPLLSFIIAIFISILINILSSIVFECWIKKTTAA